MFKHNKGFFALSIFALTISGSLNCMEKGQSSSLELSPEAFMTLPAKGREGALKKLTPEARRKLLLDAEPKHLEALRKEYLEDIKKFKEEIKKTWITIFELEGLYSGKEKTELERRLNVIFGKAKSRREKKEKITLKQPVQGQMPFQGQQQYQSQQPYQGQTSPFGQQQPYQGQSPFAVQQPFQGQPGYGQQPYQGQKNPFF